MIKSNSSSLRAQTFLEEVLDEFDASDPEEALHMLRRMKELLSQYYQERKTLHSLGLEDLDDAVDTMMVMKRRVETMQDRLDAYREAQEKLHAIQDALDVEADAEETVNTIANISEQLESLYEEREVLSRAGLSDANEAVHMIQSMQEQLNQLYEDAESDVETEGDAFALLEQELGVSDPESVIQMVASMEEQLSANADQEDESNTSPSVSDSPPSTVTAVDTLERQLLALQEGDVDLATDEFATLLPVDVLRDLDERAPEDLDTYDVGILAVDDDDRIRIANDFQPSLPGLKANPVGESFFEQVPASRNPLLQLPLQTGRQGGSLDSRFFYTFPRPEEDGTPLPVKLQFHRTEDQPITWLLYAPL
jgi:hypothetical protein